MPSRHGSPQPYQILMEMISVDAVSDPGPTKSPGVRPKDPDLRGSGLIGGRSWVRPRLLLSKKTEQLVYQHPTIGRV